VKPSRKCQKRHSKISFNFQTNFRFGFSFRGSFKIFQKIK
jgi:hypothetical protein